MCLIALAIDQQRRFPLVLAANRDEFFDRPSARLSWWQPDTGGPAILGGRDLHAGGTWLGLNAQGRLALLTNVRRPGPHDASAPSRGTIVPLWLKGDQPPDRFWMQVALSGHNPFNLIAADFRIGECYWASSEVAAPRRLGKGIFGLSNASLNTPWPKVERLKAQMAAALEECDSVAAISDHLFAALADSAAAKDADLPRTGILIEQERLLSSAFIRTPDKRYGTRCSTLLITERVGRRLVTHMIERTFPFDGGAALLRQARLRDWPPRYTVEAPRDVTPGPVSDGDDEPPAADTLKRTRVRGLLRPAILRRRA